MGFVSNTLKQDIGSLCLEDIYSEIWRRKISPYEYYRQQREMIEFIESCPETMLFIKATRGFRKSSGILNWLVEKAMQKKIYVLIASATKDQIKDIIEQQFAVIFEKYNCPEDLVPRPIKSEFRYIIPYTNSIFKFVGVDKDKLSTRRGMAYDYVFLDEIGEMRKVLGLVKSVIFPAVERRIEETGFGKIILATTPSELPIHDSDILAAECEAKGALFERDIDHSDIYTPARKQKVIEFYGSETDERYLREFKLIKVVNKERVVIPEFDKNVHVYVGHKERPQFFSPYVFMDLGLIDYTHVLFGYHDFEEDKLFIEDEIVQNHMQANCTTKDLSEKIKEKEAALWGNLKPKVRVSDNDAQLLLDLRVTHGLAFQPANKKISHYDESLINQLRKDFQNRWIVIHERCKNLISQLQNGIWNEKRTEYERIAGLGHLDGIDALKYGRRVVDRGFNPKPKGYGIDRFNQNVHLPQRRTHVHDWGE